MLIIGVAVRATDLAFLFDSHFKNGEQSVDGRQTLAIPGEYALGRSSPVQLGRIEQANTAYIHLKFRFRIEGGDRSLSVFQTAPADQGLRVEMAGPALTIVVPSSSRSGNGLIKLPMAVALTSEQWHWGEIEVLNGSFVRAVLDGHTVFNYVDSHISMATSELAIGAGPDLKSGDTARIDHIVVTKGNFALPHSAFLVVYSVEAVLCVLFCFVLWKLADRDRTHLRMLAKLALLVVPLAVVLMYAEYRLAVLNTVYFAKRVALESEIDKIETLIMGSSNTVYGVKPEALSRKAYNLAFLGNGMLFDALLLETYVERMRSLRTVVLTVNYFTMGMDYATFSQSWRQYFLRQNFGIPLSPSGTIPYYLTFLPEPRNFSRIALYGDRARGFVGSKHHEPVDMMTNPSGWLDSGDVPGNEKTKEIGRAAAEAHNASTSMENFDRNIDYWSGLAASLRHKGIRLVIVQLPTDECYWSKLDKAKVHMMKQKLTEFASRSGIRFADYAKDPRFGLDDFTPVMPDHLNARGAEKFSRILDHEVLTSFGNERQVH